jgi:hypothetical protein
MTEPSQALPLVTPDLDPVADAPPVCFVLAAAVAVVDPLCPALHRLLAGAEVVEARSGEGLGQREVEV